MLPVASAARAAAGFNPAEVAEHYANALYFWDWKEKKLIQTVPLGPKGLIPLEVGSDGGRRRT